MNRLSRGQFLSLLLINDAFSLICIRGSISLKTAVAFLLGTLIQLVFALPLVRLCGRGIGADSFGAPVKAVLLIYTIVRGGLLFGTLWETSSAVYIPYESRGITGKLLIAALIAAVCIYIAFLGYKALARSAVITAAAGAVCIAVMLIIALLGHPLSSITLSHSNGTFLGETTRGLALSGETGCFTLMISCVRGRPLRNTVAYFTGRLVLSLAVITASLLAAGGIMEISDFPVLTAARLIQPFSSQRTDALFLIVFSCFAVFALSLHTVLGGKLLYSIFPVFKKYRHLTVSVLMTAAAVTAYRIPVMFTAAASLMILLVIPTAHIFRKSSCRSQR
ncbi:MAG: hypothetical protein IKH75_06795 [Ruminococcus sp.]|nr:hypothetical protein [Ruminococcus sp.]